MKSIVGIVVDNARELAHSIEKVLELGKVWIVSWIGSLQEIEDEHKEEWRRRRKNVENEVKEIQKKWRATECVWSLGEWKEVNQKGAFEEEVDVVECDVEKIEGVVQRSSRWR